MLGKKFYLPLLLATVLFHLSATAQPTQPSTGRLKSGKPYRIDREGVTITDSLAEFEVENIELRQDVARLEDELLQAKEQLRGKGISCDTVVQRSENSLKLKISSLEAAVRAAENKVAECSAQLTPARNEVQQLRSALSQSPSNSVLKSITDEKSRLELQLVERDETLRERDLQLKQMIEQRQAAQATLARTQSELEGARREKELAIQDLKLARAEGVQSKSPAKLENPTPESSAPRAALAPAVASTPVEVSGEADGVELEYSPEMKKALQASLSNIQSKIIQRKSLADKLQGSRRGISVKIQPLVTKSGTSLDELRVLVGKLESSPERLTEVQKGVAEIEGILVQDIAVLQRLS